MEQSVPVRSRLRVLEGCISHDAPLFLCATGQGARRAVSEGQQTQLPDLQQHELLERMLLSFLIIDRAASSSRTAVSREFACQDCHCLHVGTCAIALLDDSSRLASRGRAQYQSDLISHNFYYAFVLTEV